MARTTKAKAKKAQEPVVSMGAEIFAALKQAEQTKGRPTAIIANTVKGKGVSYMEHVAKWHRSVITPEQYQQAIKEINAREDLL